MTEALRPRLVAALAASAVAVAVVASAAVVPGVRPLPRTGVPVETAALLLSGQEGGSFAMEVLAVPRATPAAAGEVPVDLVVELDGAALLAELERPAGNPPPARGELTLELAVYALRAGEVAAALGRAWSVDRARHAEAIGSGGIRVVTRLLLTEADYELRVLARVGTAVAVRKRAVSVAVEDGSPGALLVAAAAGWLELVDARAPGGVAGLATGVTAMPVLVGGGPLHLSPSEPLAGAGPISLELSDAGGGVVARLELAPGTPAGRGLTAALPGELPLGTLRALLVAGERSGSAVDVRVARQPGAWTTAGRAVAAAPPPTESADRPAKRRRVGAAKLRETLLAALAEDARSPPGAAGALERWHAAALLGQGDVLPGPVDGEDVEAAEERVSQRLAERDHTALPALIGILLEAREDHLAARQYWLAARLEPQVRRLVELHVEHGGDRRLAASALLALAARLVETGQRGGASSLATLANQLVPTDAAAGLLLVQGAELREEPAEALRVLRRLLAVDGLAATPRAEARLRLGVALRRSGDFARADAELATLAAEDGTPGWIRELAWEERLRLRLAGSIPGRDLAELAAAARAALPDSTTLLLLSAAARERAGDARGARALLGELVVEAGGGGIGSRRRYVEVPGPVREAEASFWKAARAGRAQLAAVLGVLHED